MPLPSPLPSSGRREGPKNSIRMTPMRSSSLNPRLPMGILLCCGEKGLDRSVDTAQEAAQMPGQRDDADAQQLDRHALPQQGLAPPTRPEVQPPDQQNHRTRRAREQQVQEKDAFELLAFE